MILSFIEWLKQLTNSEFMPHGMCYMWQPATLWPNVLGDGITAVSYFVIPGLLIYFVKKRENLEFKGVFWAFAAFIVSCGAVHVISMVNVWVPLYNLSGLLKMLMAVVSLGTVFILYLKLPEALQIPIPGELEEVNKKLLEEIHKKEILQRELEEKTKELQQTIDSLIEIQTTAKIGTWEVDVKNMTCEWSDEVYRIHEVEEKTPIKVEDGINFYREDYQSVIDSAVNAAISENSSWDEECVLVTNTGKERWVRAIGHPVYEGDNLLKLRGLFMDIDKQKNDQFVLEEQKRELEEITTKLSLAVTTGKIGVWQWDIETNALEWDDQMLDIFGITREEFTNGYDSYAEAVLPEDLPSIESRLEQAIKNKERFDADFRINKRDGSIGYLVAKADLVLNAEGKPSKMIGINYDITSIEVAKKEIQEKEQQLRKFVEQAPVAVAMLDNKMNYLSVSNQWYTEYSLAKENIIGKCHYDVFPEIRENTAWLNNHKRVLAGEELSSKRDKFVRDDGKVQYISWKLIPWYNKPDEVGGMIMYTADITNEIKYQETLENLNEVLEHQVEMRTKELNTANKELEAFSYSISHDLRAPLRSINGFADILEEDYRDKLDEEGKRLVGIIKNSGIQMGRLIDDILSFSRFGRKELQKGNVAIGEVVEEVIQGVTLSNSELDMDFTVKKLPIVKGDLPLLKQVLINLISNAVKYSSKKEQIKIEIDAIEKGEEIVFAIKDNGSGFDMKYHDKLFGVFQRLHSSNEYEGTGVGLAIVQRIINKHGGEVWAESELEKGSIFYFSLPSN